MTTIFFGDNISYKANGFSLSEGKVWFEGGVRLARAIRGKRFHTALTFNFGVSLPFEFR
ncbi:MAG: hypothetical protein P8H56_08710 [Crocinitomicaceae bacterium]|nr:hypothetical protein [Crocinitomicaceae bacterium]MDG1658648.1 hypothetical protein [Crocinitomicaceae bacterium]